jgi:hypothetical protein
MQPVAAGDHTPWNEQESARGNIGIGRIMSVNEIKPLRVGVLGTGNWGRVHIEAYWRNPETELVAICGQSNRERVERMASSTERRPIWIWARC